MVLVSLSFSRCVNFIGRGQVLVLVLILNLPVLVLVLVLVLKGLVLITTLIIMHSKIVDSILLHFHNNTALLHTTSWLWEPLHGRAREEKDGKEYKWGRNGKEKKTRRGNTSCQILNEVYIVSYIAVLFTDRHSPRQTDRHPPRQTCVSHESSQSRALKAAMCNPYQCGQRWFRWTVTLGWLQSSTRRDRRTSRCTWAADRRQTDAGRHGWTRLVVHRIRSDTPSDLSLNSLTPSTSTILTRSRWDRREPGLLMSLLWFLRLIQWIDLLLGPIGLHCIQCCHPHSAGV